MTKDDIIKLAREANCEETFGTDTFLCTVVDLERFANLVAAAEREECAKVCDDHEQYPSLTPRHCAAAIRARGTP